MLEGTQISIMSTSDLLMEPFCEHLIPFTVDLWQRLLSRSHRSKKVAYVYLANELIQKGMSVGNDNYHRAFEPVIGKSLI